MIFKRLAYYIVSKDLRRLSNMFRGEYDALHGSDKFMSGVQLVVEAIAYFVSPKYGDKISKEFNNNRTQCEKDAGKLNE